MGEIRIGVQLAFLLASLAIICVQRTHEDEESCSRCVDLGEAGPFVAAFVPALGCGICAISAIIL